MIDWYNLFMNSLWILACALALATISYASWQASVAGEKFRVCLRRSGIQISLNVAGLLFCAGLVGTSEILWQRILWILLAIGFAVQIGVEVFKKNSKSNSETQKD
jgi:hypothetical protein